MEKKNLVYSAIFTRIFSHCLLITIIVTAKNGLISGIKFSDLKRTVENQDAETWAGFVLTRSRKEKTEPYNI